MDDEQSTTRQRHKPRAARVSDTFELQSVWTAEDYRSLLTILGTRARFVSSREFCAGTSGVWLRHDVELSLEAAVRMGHIERDLGVVATYFLCVESPLVAPFRSDVTAVAAELRACGHEVSYHLVIEPGLRDVADRLEDLEIEFPEIRPEYLTFHAPGISVETLASVPIGQPIYQPMLDKQCHYFSDSTGRWRWGNPLDASFGDGESVQLLTHPFWWSGDSDRPAILRGDHNIVGGFLPQYRMSQAVP